VFDEKAETESFAKLFFPFFVLAFQKGITLGLAQGEGKTKPEDLFTLGVRETLRQQAFEHAALAVSTTKDELQSLIGTAITEGHSIPDLAKAINQQFQLDSRVRSVRIARTELTRVITHAKVRALAAEGYLEKQWSTVVDGRERESHASANGQVVPIDAYFSLSGMACFAPGDDMLPPSESINCRCDVVGAGVPEDRRLQLGELFLRAHGALERRLVIELRRAFQRQRERVLSHFPS
jgi:F like protein